MSAGASGLVEYEVDKRVATLTLNRPEKLNAISRALTSELAAALSRFDGDAAAEVAVIVGKGRAFSAGADVQEGQLLSREEMAALPDPMAPGEPFADLLMKGASWKPVIAAVHGYALGLALGLVLECDLIVAEEGCRFQITETGRGLGGYRHWARLRARGVGAFADEVALTGRFFSAEEALGAGIVSRVAPKGTVLAAATALAAEIAANPPLSVRETVRIRRWQMRQMVSAVAAETAATRLELTEDFAEAARAFAEKRPPGPFKAR